MKQIISILFFSLLTTGIDAQFSADSTRRVQWAAIPVVNYSNTLGGSFGLMASTFYKLSRRDTISPSSSTGFFGMFTTNKSNFFSLYQQLYLREDRWRILAAVGKGNINAQYWQNLPIQDGIFVGFASRISFAVLSVERKVYRNLYVGVHGLLVDSELSFDLPDFVPDSLKNDSRNMHNLGFKLSYDRRDHQINPHSGYNVTFRTRYYREWLQSGDNFDSYDLTYNHFFRIKNERNILVARTKITASTGEVPFQGKNVVGQDDIRGYSSGRYRNNQVYALQAEYRWNFYKRLGMVGFLGVASATEDFPGIFENELLPGGGVGFRYMMLPGERINIGIDIAKGKGDWGLYFRIGEAFGR